MVAAEPEVAREVAQGALEAGVTRLARTRTVTERIHRALPTSARITRPGQHSRRVLARSLTTVRASATAADVWSGVAQRRVPLSDKLAIRVDGKGT